MRVVILGANGQLGTDLVKVLSAWELVPWPHSEVDVCDFSSLKERLSATKPACVINTAAFNRVDDCEDQPDRAFSVNAYGARNVAKICVALDCILMHISTDYVFSGRKASAYTEDDAPNPLSVYGVSKLAGEYFVRNICPKHFVIRTSGLYGRAGSSSKGGNFVETMIRLANEGKPLRVVNDQILTPTSTVDLAEKIKQLLQTKAYGLYHITNTGHCSWYEFATKIFTILGLQVDLAPTTTAAFAAKARRPAFSVLAHDRLLRIGLERMRVWEEALEDYLVEKGHVRTTK